MIFVVCVLVVSLCFGLLLILCLVVICECFGCVVLVWVFRFCLFDYLVVCLLLVVLWVG